MEEALGRRIRTRKYHESVMTKNQYLSFEVFKEQFLLELPPELSGFQDKRARTFHCLSVLGGPGVVSGVRERRENRRRK